MQLHHTGDRKSRIKISEHYLPEFEGKRVELILLINQIRKILEADKISVDDLKAFLGVFCELRSAVTVTTSLREAINVVGDRTSLINTNYLLAIAKEFQLHNAIVFIKLYNDSIDKFCKKIPTAHAYGQEFMTYSSGFLQEAETVEFVLEWDPHPEGRMKMLSDIQGLLRKAFHDQARYVMLKVVLPNNSIVVICYAPEHLHELLARLIKDNEVGLEKEKVISVTIGGNVILKREPECTVRISCLI